MCMPLDDVQMTCWLQSQLQIMTVWMDELATRPDGDLTALERLERHRQWLSSELDRLGVVQSENYGGV